MVENALIALIVIPPIVMVIPLFRLWVDLKLVYTYQGAVIIYTGLMLPFSIFLLANFFRGIPRSLAEAASMGLAHAGAAVGVLPLSKPALITLALVQGLWVWNELLIAVIFLQGSADHSTLMVGPHDAAEPVSAKRAADARGDDAGDDPGGRGVCVRAASLARGSWLGQLKG